MINSLKMSFKIDITYAINSFIYNIKRFPLLKDLFPGNDLYKSKKAKKIIRILGVILSTIRVIMFKILYFATIYIIATMITPKDIVYGILIEINHGTKIIRWVDSLDKMFKLEEEIMNNLLPKETTILTKKRTVKR